MPENSNSKNQVPVLEQAKEIFDKELEQDYRTVIKRWIKKVLKSNN